ncbi:hypothetical protein [Streptomyces sp. NPDC046942]|uniref:hypothetical protein n=1 Tax=Streptomyces sp. NPDC046942 TaxID=3155137 RepID=UPI0033F365F0
MADAERSKFLKDINAESPLELVIRAHLWIESRMIELLCDLVPYPDRIDFDRFTFPQKVALVAAHGALEQEDVPAYLKLNSMRNKVAHRLEAALSAEDEAALINCLSPKLRHVSMVDEPGVRTQPWPHALRSVLAAMVTVVKAQREALLRARGEQRKIAAEVALLARELREEREQREAARAATASLPTQAAPLRTGGVQDGDRHQEAPGAVVMRPTDV